MAKKIKLAKERVKSNYSGKNNYDMVIIGAGLTGLATGLMYLKNTSDQKILILEQGPYPGGYCTAYERQGYVFETNQLFPNIIDILEYLEIDIPLKRYEGNFMRRILVKGDSHEEYKLPSDPKVFTKYLVEQFPEYEKQIENLLDYQIKMFAQTRKLKSNMKLLDKVSTVINAPLVMANLNKTYAELLDKFGIEDLRLREVMETFTSFSGVPSSMASAIYTTGGMLSSMSKTFRPKGFFDEFPTLLAEKFQELGGEVLLESEVEAIHAEDGVAKGVSVKGQDQMINAGLVVSTIDPNVAMRKLLGDKHLPAKYIERLENTQMSVSSLNIALGLDDDIDLESMDLDYPYNVASTGLGTGDELYNAFLKGENAFREDCFHMAIVCPSLTTRSKNTITIRAVPFAMGEWEELRKKDYKKYTAKKEEMADFFIGLAEKYFVPGLRKHIVVKDISTPATYARYSGSPTGSIYDIASLVTQFGPKRLPMKTPVKNLYMPKFAHAIYGTMMNGVQIVDLLLDRKFNNGNSLFIPKK